MSRLRDWLTAADAPALLLLGQYCVGKTHFLKLAQSLSIQEGFASAFVTLDATDAPLYKPKRVYRRLFESFRCSSGVPGQLLSASDLIEKTDPFVAVG